MVAAHHIVTIGMQDESELLLRELDDDYFGALDDSDASAAAASAAAESYESKEPSSDEDAPAARCVDLDAALVHIVECGSGDEDLVVSATDDVLGPQKESGKSEEGEQLITLVKAEVCDLFHVGYKSEDVTHYSVLENQQQVLVRLMTFLTSSTCYIKFSIWRIKKSHFLYPHMLIFEALKKYLLLITWI